jgi:sulfatase maturation enzyme AslB (radical SAM superfamily)
MHTNSTSGTSTTDLPPILDFVWLELTNRCNLQCVHCYADSGPSAGGTDVLTEDDYLGLIDQIYDLGCRKIQFIGGEPTLNRSLPKLIEAASQRGFEFIEVYTNLIHLSDDLLTVFCRFQVAVATSFYSHNPKTHDTITNRHGSFQLTVQNIQRVLNADLILRAGIVEMDQNKDDVVKTREFLENLGIKDVGTDRLRAFGRAEKADCSGLGELCGNCAGSILSIGPDGIVSPCIMSKQWPVGSLLEAPLAQIATSHELTALRKSIQYATCSVDQLEMGGCNPDRRNPCGPDSTSCRPCNPNGHCGPNDCQPVRRPR